LYGARTQIWYRQRYFVVVPSPTGRVKVVSHLGPADQNAVFLRHRGLSPVGIHPLDQSGTSENDAMSTDQSGTIHNSPEPRVDNDWPVQDQQWRNHLYTVCPQKPRIRSNFGARVRKTSQFVVMFFLTVRKAVAAGADVFRTKAAQRHAPENSYGDVVRNLKG